ncbi:MAG: glycosyltransferase family 2 protein [Defluviimonas sp.]|nr:glycosyltransferase family 2 protein [Defluviimonas sp.]
MGWDVVATVRAPRPYVQRFVDRYRQLGASTIHIFHDDPDFACALAGDDLVQTVCDAAYWGDRRPRPVEMRQTHNATLAAGRSSAEWLLHCDVDEHICAARDVGEVLAEVPAACACLIALPLEAVYDRRPRSVDEIFATPYFKTTAAGWAASRAFWQEVNGDLHRFSAAGFWGHRVGKSFIRLSGLPPGQPMPIHMPSGEAFRLMNPARSADLRLLHFDALLPAEWLRKHTDRATGRVRTRWLGEKRTLFARFVHDTLEAGGEPAALELYDRLFVLHKPVLDRAIAGGLVAHLREARSESPDTRP